MINMVKRRITKKQKLALAEKRNVRTGLVGELTVQGVLLSLPADYYVCHNVMLRTANGFTTQLDHVVVSKYGIFVIETKAHSGYISGDCNQKYWSQTFYRKNGTPSYPKSFYSPYLQNAGHLKNLYRITGLPYNYFLGLIVFSSQNVNLSNVYCSNVVHINYLYNIILSYKRPIMSNETVQEVCNLISTQNIQSKYFERKHKAYVESFKSSKNKHPR